MTHNFHIGNIQVSTNNINELKDVVCEISEKLGDGEKLSKYISDFIFDVESAYQSYHRLGPDNWDKIHK